MPSVDLLYPPCTPVSPSIWQFSPFPILVSLGDHLQMDFIRIKIDVCWGWESWFGALYNLGLTSPQVPSVHTDTHTHTQSVQLYTAHLFHFSHFNSCPISLDLSKTDGSPSWNLKWSMWAT